MQLSSSTAAASPVSFPHEMHWRDSRAWPARMPKQLSGILHERKLIFLREEQRLEEKNADRSQLIPHRLRELRGTAPSSTPKDAKDSERPVSSSGNQQIVRSLRYLRGVMVEMNEGLPVTILSLRKCLNARTTASRTLGIVFTRTSLIRPLEHRAVSTFPKLKSVL